MSNRIRITALLGTLGLLAVSVGFLLSDRGDSETPPRLRELSRSELELRDGLLYAAGESEPFEGTLVEAFPNHRKRLAIEIRAGKPHGRSRGWYENGQLEVEEYFEAGVSHGLRRRWYANGARKSETPIVRGQVEGAFTRWHDNGQRAAAASLIQGKPHGLSQAWYSSGALKSRAVMEQGRVVSREFFKEEDREGS